MKRRNFFRFAWGVSVLQSVSNFSCAEEVPATALSVEYPDSYPGLVKFHIVRPGKYFLKDNYIQRASYVDDKGRRHRPTGGMMMAIFCGGVEIDLQGHMLGADVEMGGISLNPATNMRLAKMHKTMSGGSDSRNVTVRNGIIDLASGQNTGDAIEFADLWQGYNRRTVERPDDGGGRLLAISYKKNNFRFESLKVLSNKVAITVEGSYTIIKNCVIESADLAAIFVAGDHVLIENCDIRLRRPKGLPTYPRAAIVLRDASHAVIRNNRIRVDGGSDNKNITCGILVRDGAVNVLIENNTFVNVKGDPVVLAEGATAVVRDNKYETHLF